MGFITGILIYFSFSTAIVAIALGFGLYLGSLTGLHFGYFPVIFAIILIFLLSILNIVGIKKAASADFFLVITKLGMLTIFVISAIVLAYSTKTLNTSNFTVPPAKNNIYAIFSASIAVFFAYSGFQSISTLTSDVKGGANKAAKGHSIIRCNKHDILHTCCCININGSGVKIYGICRSLGICIRLCSCTV